MKSQNINAKKKTIVNATERPNTRKRGSSGLRDKKAGKASAQSQKAKPTRGFDNINPDEGGEPELNETEKAIQHLNSMKKAADSLRQLVHEFLLKKMHVVLKKEDSLKGARACLKSQLPSQYSSLCRKLNAAYVEIELGIRHGKWSVNTLLEFFRYVEEDWGVILKSVGASSSPSVEDFKAKCEQLLALDKIRLKNASSKENISEKSYAKIMECLPNITSDMLDSLHAEIENRLDSETQPHDPNEFDGLEFK